MSTEESNIADESTPTFGGGIEVRKIGYSLYLLIANRYLECRCSYLPYEQGAMMTPAEFAQALKTHKVIEGIDQEAFNDFAAKAAIGIQLSGVLIASGTPPLDGTDQYFTMLAPFSTFINEEEDDNAVIDMYAVQKFINVEDGEAIGRIVPAEPGSPGRNIMGQPMPQQPGKNMKYTIGKNIRLEEGGTLMLATATGRFCHVRGEFSVEEEYIIKGNVDFKIGHITHRGHVEVRGDVLDGFNITAEKGLLVTGNIGTCTIISEGDISFCGMDGDGKGRIICGGTLRAKYIHDTTIECDGDVIVDVEIHNCTIKTLGRIIVQKDTISGGSYIAQGGIEANKLGSPSARHTTLLVGVDYRYIEELKRLLQELGDVQGSIRDACSLDEVIELRKNAAELSDLIAATRCKAVAAANAKINVKAKLHENVRMALGSVTHTIDTLMSGPMTIIENIVDGGLRFLPMSNLDINGTELEMAIINEQREALLKSSSAEELSTLEAVEASSPDE